MADLAFANLAAAVREALPPLVVAAAPMILHDAAAAIAARAASRDCADGERSMARCVAAFNALYGQQLTEVQGWQFMSLLKKSRATAGQYHLDDYIDDSAYAALAGECAMRAANQDATHG